MDIEIWIRTGKRRRLDSGTIKWEEYKDENNLITYEIDEQGAIDEALFQVKIILRKSLGIKSGWNEKSEVK